MKCKTGIGLFLAILLLLAGCGNTPDMPEGARLVYEDIGISVNETSELPDIELYAYSDRIELNIWTFAHMVSKMEEMNPGDCEISICLPEETYRTTLYAASEAKEMEELEVPQEWKDFLEELETEGTGLQDFISEQEAEEIRSSIDEILEEELEKYSQTEDFGESTTESNLYETEELSSVTIGEVQFQIPKIWEERTKQEGDSNYYYYEDLMFVVQMHDETEMTNEELVDDIKQDFIDGIKGEDGELRFSMVVEVDGREALVVSVNRMLSDIYYEITTLNFVYNMKLYSLGFCVKDGSTVNYYHDFYMMKATVVIGDSAEAPQQEGNTVPDEEEGDGQSDNVQENTDDNLPTVTTGQRNALDSAKSYLSIMPFSYTGLIEQLQYEKYTYIDGLKHRVINTRCFFNINMDKKGHGAYGGKFVERGCGKADI